MSVFFNPLLRLAPESDFVKPNLKGYCSYANLDWWRVCESWRRICNRTFSYYPTHSWFWFISSYSTILPNNTTHTVHKKAIVSSIAHNPISSSSPNLLPSLSRSTPWTSSSTFHNTVLLRRVNNIPLVPLLGVNERYLFKHAFPACDISEIFFSFSLRKLT